eukprot:TRINITY_DN1667_c0_g2_i13.p2 TRINITY_DN1667_c0_g2~~TRINITY_DN1667_c0_g2_i13.p2  ORF type:complete len:120 (-),score=7.25 TRINITY_DN1667_c0_g2_i13:121-480(-)
MSMVSSQCLGQANCSVTASNSIFGNPLVLRFSCPADYSITTINFASWGVPDSFQCAKHFRSCHSNKSYDVVASTCLKQNKCQVIASDVYFWRPISRSYKKPPCSSNLLAYSNKLRNYLG